MDFKVHLKPWNQITKYQILLHMCIFLGELFIAGILFKWLHYLKQCNKSWIGGFIKVPRLTVPEYKILCHLVVMNMSSGFKRAGISAKLHHLLVVHLWALYSNFLTSLFCIINRKKIVISTLDEIGRIK